MKYLLFFSSFFLAVNSFSQGNTGSRKKNSRTATTSKTTKTTKKASGNEVAMEELHINNKPASTKEQPGAPAPQKTKLDDLKNPFDSTKKAKTNQPAIEQNNSHDRYANNETNYKQDNKQLQRPAAQNAEKTKLDDLKNPFDTTKRVVAPKNTVQQKGTNQRTTGSRTRQGGRRN